MDDRWERIKQLFEAALERDEPERSQFLAGACQNHEERHAVESLLSGEKNAGDFLLAPVARLPPTSPTTTSDNLPCTFSPGEIISGRFKILRFIGRGGMGEVYEARDLKLLERVALKTIRSEVASDPKTLERFKKEIQLARRVRHPNVCRMYDLEEHQPLMPGSGPPISFLAMELLEGETLANRLHRQGRMSSEEALPLIRQMADGLAAAHKEGVVHCDFKPGNVMLVSESPAHMDSSQSTQSIELAADQTSLALRRSAHSAAVSAVNAAAPGMNTDLRAVIADFGLARAIRPTITHKAVQESLDTGSHLVGTLPYMAPEQLGGHAATPTSDVYALGLVMYEMVTGQQPFSGVTPLSAIYKRLQAAPPAPRILVPGLDPSLESIILRCLQKEPALRFQSAREVVQELDQHPAPLDRWRQKETAHWIARRKPIAAAMALAGALVVVAAVLARAPLARWTAAIAQQVSTAGRPPVRRRVLIGDFDNRTGEPIFDPTLRELVTTSLEQSQLLSVFPSVAIHEALQRMRRAPSVRIDQDLGLDMCLRENLGALVLGSISRIGSIYVINLRALAPDGETLFSADDQAADQRKVLSALDRLVARLREKLGESLESIRKVGEPLDEVTSQSLQAVQLYSQGKRALFQTQFALAQSLMERAVQLDPNFAMAYEYLGAIDAFQGMGQEGQENLRRASELADRLTERERLKILGDYDLMGLHDIPKAINQYQLLLSLYPDDYGAHSNLLIAYHEAGRFDLAAHEAQEAVKLVDVPAGRSNLAYAYFYAGQKERAVRVAEDALRTFPEASSDLVYALAMFSLADGDFEGTKAYLGRLGSIPGSGADVDGVLADIDMCQGRYLAAIEKLQAALVIDGDTDDRSAQARARLQLASLYLDFGDKRRAVDEATQGARLAQQPEISAWAASLLAEIGDVAQARDVLRSVEQAGWQPWIVEVRAEILLAQGRPGIASKMVDSELGLRVPTSLLETKARVYEADRRFADAVDAYKQLLARRSERTINDGDQPAFHRVVAAYYRLGVLYDALGDIPAAKASLERYLGFCSEPDPNVPFLKDARARLNRLAQPVPAKQHDQGRAPTPAAYMTDSPTPSMPRSLSIMLSASAAVQNGANPSQVAVRQNVWQTCPASRRTVR